MAKGKNDMIAVGGVNLPATIDKALLSNVEKHLRPPKKKKGMLTDESPVEKLTYAKILQPTSTLEMSGVFENIRPGDLFIENKILGNKLTVFPLLIWNSRAKWERDASGQGATLDCSSPNAVTPLETKYSKLCNSCVHSMGTKQNPSQCVRTTNVLVVDTMFSSIFVLQFSKTSARAGSKMLDFMYAGEDSDPVYHMAVNVKSERAKTGVYYVFSVTPDLKTQDDFLPALEALQDKFQVIVKSQIDHLLGKIKTQEVEEKDENIPTNIPDSIDD